MKVALKENNNNKHAFRESDDVQIQKYTMINVSKYIYDLEGGNKISYRILKEFKK